jgi:hypothetical protein
VGALFTLNLFVGVIIDNFTKLKRQLEREGKSQSMFLSADQLAILDSLRFFLRSGPTKAPPRPGNDLASFRNRCYDVAVSVRFEVYIMCLIVLNMVRSLPQTPCSYHECLLLYSPDVPQARVSPFRTGGGESIQNRALHIVLSEHTAVGG